MTTRLARPSDPRPPFISGGSVRFGQDGRPAVLTLVKTLPNSPPLHQVLSAAGYHVWRAVTTSEAMAAGVKEANIGILICDMVLASGPGVAFLAALRAKLAASRVLGAIFMADTASINDVVMTLRAGALDFVSRQLAPEQILEVVRRAEVTVRQLRSARMVAAEANRLAEAATILARRLSSDPPAEGNAAVQSAQFGFEQKLPLEVGATNVHARTLLDRRQAQLAAALRAQTMRERAFGELATNSAAWAMVLDLYDKTLRNQSLSVSSLCLASGAPTSTAIRRLDELVESGLIRREKDPADARRTLVILTEDARERMNAYLDAIT
jgi:DNA-binding NarL/FixJ family response regulator